MFLDYIFMVKVMVEIINVKTLSNLFPNETQILYSYSLWAGLAFWGQFLKNRKIKLLIWKEKEKNSWEIFPL